MRENKGGERPCYIHTITREEKKRLMASIGFESVKESKEEHEERELRRKEKRKKKKTDREERGGE